MVWRRWSSPFPRYRVCFISGGISWPAKAEGSRTDVALRPKQTVSEAAPVQLKASRTEERRRSLDPDRRQSAKMTALGQGGSRSACLDGVQGQRGMVDGEELKPFPPRELRSLWPGDPICLRPRDAIFELQGSCSV